MKHKLLSFAAALSLLLSVAVCVLWVRSYGLSDQLDWRCDGGWRSVRSAQGRVAVGLLLADWSGQPADFYGLKYERGKPRPPFNHRIFLGPDEGDTWFGWERGGFAWYGKRNARRGILDAQGVAPFWCIAAATAVLPLGWTTFALARTAAPSAARQSW